MLTILATTFTSILSSILDTNSLGSILASLPATLTTIPNNTLPISMTVTQAAWVSTVNFLVFYAVNMPVILAAIGMASILAAIGISTLLVIISMATILAIKSLVLSCHTQLTVANRLTKTF
jgi:hypothetical protein